MNPFFGAVSIDDLKAGVAAVTRAFVGDQLVWYRSLPTLATDIYFSASGDDWTGDGTIGSPFRSLVMANFVADTGKRLWFNGGDTFEGTLVCRENCEYDSYGSGRAIISAGTGKAILAENVAVSVKSFECIGSGLTNTDHGIYALNSSWAYSGVISGLVIQDCVIHGFGRNGIFAEASNFPSGYYQPLIDGNEVYNCTVNDAAGNTAGIHVAAPGLWGQYVYGPSHWEVTITNNNVHDCPGSSGASNHVGSGILVAQTEIGLIEANVASDNGTLSSNQAGPVAIWTWDSTQVVIRKNAVYRQSTAGPDGAAYDMDGGCQDCVIEYNYSEGCKGPGVLLFSWDDTAYWPNNRMLDYARNIARFNISNGDGANNEYSKYSLFIGTMRPVVTDFQDIQVYHNTIISRAVGQTDPLCVNINTFNQVEMNHATGIIGNNLFVHNGNGLVIDMRRNQIEIAGNVYYSAGTGKMRYYGFDWPTPLEWSQSIDDDGPPYSPKEYYGAAYTYFWGDPELVSNNGTTIADYAPVATSAIIGQAYDIFTAWSIPVPTEDYNGDAFPSAPYTAGAINPLP